MKYSLDVLDKLNVYATQTVFENNPTYRVFLDENVDELRLKNALNDAFSKLPYMNTKLAYDGVFYLEDNKNELVIHNCKFEDRPLVFGDHMFQLSYYENAITFDWSHIATDGLGFLVFVKAVLASYFNIDINFDPSLYTSLPLDGHDDENVSVNYLKKQDDGFDEDIIKHKNTKGLSTCTTLAVASKEVLNFRNRADATPAAVVSALLTKTFRKHLRDNGGLNDNVKCKIVVSTRNVLDVETMHNCYLNLFVTYNDKFDKFSFDTLCTIFRTYIDLAIQKETVLFDLNKQRESLQVKESNLNQKQVFEDCKKQAIEKRKNYCNINFSYIGELPFEKEIMCHIKKFDSYCFNENCEFGIFGYSYNGDIYLTISENYIDSDIIKEFIDYSKDLGVNFKVIDKLSYQQSFFKLPKID